MIVFVPIEDISGLPSCAFLDTVTDCFLENSFGCHTFDAAEIEEHEQAARLRGLVPDGFWETRKCAACGRTIPPCDPDQCTA